jgi:hypothetical protein
MAEMQGFPVKKGQIKKGDVFTSPFLYTELLLLLPDLSEALAAVNGTIRLGIEGDLRLTAAASASGSEILPRTTGSGLTSVSAGLAALGLVLETALCIELLLTGSEHEFLAALFAYKRLVFVHVLYPLFDSFAQVRISSFDAGSV